MARKKPRTASSEPPESPVVSDDDGIDINYVQPSNLSLNQVEHLAHLETNGEESDSSSDGDVNPVGDIPMRWYEGYDHIGYNRSGEKIVPTNRPSALDLAADPHAWRKIYDEKNDQLIELSHSELQAIAKLMVGRYPSYDADTQGELIAWSGPVVQHALSSGTDPKRRFLPSKHEARAVVKLVRAMRAGTITRPSEEKADLNDRDLYRYDIWDENDPKAREEMTKSERARDIMRVPAMKPPLPTNKESYNPPEEYLPKEKEAERWKSLDAESRSTPYLPTKFQALRHVPAYDNFTTERFERCLDMYLAVRVFKDQRKLGADDLVPDLPNPEDLRPFPTDIVSSFGPLPSRARSIDVHLNGLWLLSGYEDGCVRVWDVSTGYLRATWDLSSLAEKIDDLQPPVCAVAWCPRERAYVFAAAIGKSLVFVDASRKMGVNGEESASILLNVHKEGVDERVREVMEDADVVWQESRLGKSAETQDDDDGDGEGETNGPSEVNGGSEIEAASSDNEETVITISHPRPLRTFSWHRKGDYVAAVGRNGSFGLVAIHRLSQRATQLPFRKKTSLVQAVKFHPTRPFFFVATTHHVRVYNLAVQKLVKTLKPGVSWISSIDVHPSGDHVLVTSYDKRVCWFDMDMSTQPYKTIRNHEKAVRVGKFHPRLPLFADGSDDGCSHVFHGAVFDDLNKNALIVPVRKLRGCCKIVDSLGVLDVAWHPRLPWLFTSGADGGIHLVTDCS